MCSMLCQGWQHAKLIPVLSMPAQLLLDRPFGCILL